MNFPQALGYSCAGVVEGVGDGVHGFKVGDAVACAGAGYANHAEWVLVPTNLVAAVPAGLGSEDACFVTLGAIALQGVRVASPALGETCAVVGLGLLGLLTVQILEANGVRAVGVDLDPAKVELARRLGATGAEVREGLEAADLADRWTEGRGFDHVLVTASTKSDDPVNFAAELLRRKGIMVLVGDVGMNFQRRPLYFGELEVRMSMSYGPGSYDRE